MLARERNEGAIVAQDRITTYDVLRVLAVAAARPDDTQRWRLLVDVLKNFLDSWSSSSNIHKVMLYVAFRFAFARVQRGEALEAGVKSEAAGLLQNWLTEKLLRFTIASGDFMLNENLTYIRKVICRKIRHVVRDEADYENSLDLLGDEFKALGEKRRSPIVLLSYAAKTLQYLRDCQDRCVAGSQELQDNIVMQPLVAGEKLIADPAGHVYKETTFQRQLAARGGVFHSPYRNGGPISGLEIGRRCTRDLLVESLVEQDAAPQLVSVAS